jgi:hypothetical protein
MTAVGSKERCPFCKEEIAPGALICKHCHSIIKLPPPKKKVPTWRNKFLLGFYAGILFMALMIYLYVKLL